MKLYIIKKNNALFQVNVRYHNLSFLVKDLFQANRSRNEKMESWVNNLLSDFKDDEKNQNDQKPK